MVFVTKWWYTLPLDGPDKMYWGFPLAFLGEGFHTSMSFQFFIMEFCIDFIIYFLFWIILILAYRKYFSKQIPINILKIIWPFSIVLTLVFSIFISMSNPIFKYKRDYDWKIMATGYMFIWENTPSKNMNEFQP